MKMAKSIKEAKEELLELHGQLKITLSNHIGIKGDELKKLKSRVSHKISPKDLERISDPIDFFNILETKGVFKIGKYDYITRIIGEFDKSLTHETHDVGKILGEISELSKYISKAQNDAMTANHASVATGSIELTGVVSSLSSSRSLAETQSSNVQSSINPRHNINVQETGTDRPTVENPRGSQNLKKRSNVESDENAHEYKRAKLQCYEKTENSRMEIDASSELRGDCQQDKQTVNDILQQIGLQEHCALFEDEKIDLETFWKLTPEILRSMGLKVGEWTKITGFIEKNKITNYHTSSNLPSLTLKPYQQELATRALHGENTIVFSRTNSGKTYIAFSVIMDHLRKFPKGKVLFTAKTTILCYQQSKRAQDVLKDPTISICTISSEEERTDLTLAKLMEIHNVFFMTPQLLVNDMKRDDEHSVRIDDFTLLVFDECHHTMGFSSYNNIMAFYRSKRFGNGRPDRKLPQILGLTASPGIYKSKSVDRAAVHVKTLMANLDVINMSTVVNEKSDYGKYFDAPQKENMPTASREEDPVSISLKKAIAEIENRMRTEAVGNSLNNLEIGKRVWKKIVEHPVCPDRNYGRYRSWLQDLKSDIESLDISTVSDEIRDKVKEIVRFLHSSVRHSEVYLEAYNINNDLDYADVKSFIQTEMEKLEKESQTDCSKEEKDLIVLLKDVAGRIPDQKSSNPDLLQIIKILENEYKVTRLNSRFMVFVKTRMIATILADRLPGDLRACHLTGSSASSEKGGLSQEDQMYVIEKFQLGIHRCLVATSVGFEGLDIKECNLAVSYKVDTSTISSIQMRGRIRKKDGTHYILGTGKQIRREELNVERQLIMHQAVNYIIEKMDQDPITITDELEKIQQNTYMKEKARKESTEEHKVDEQFEVHCGKCSERICESDFLRKFEVHHVVIDNDVINRITKGPLKKEKKNIDDGFKKKNKAFGLCGHDWGVIMEKDGVDFVVLSQNSIKIYNVQGREYEKKMKKWKDNPFKVNEINMKEILSYKEKLEQND